MAEWDTTVNVAPEAPAPETVDVLGGAPSVDAKVAQERAEKYHRGLGQESPGVETVYQSILSGGELRDREIAAHKFNLNLSAEREQMVRAYISTRESKDIFVEDIDNIRELTSKQTAALRRADPKTVFEKAYAKSLAEIKPSKVVEQEKIERPVETEKATQGAQTLIVGREIALKIYDELEADKKTRPWLNFDPNAKESSQFHDFMEYLVPLRRWYNVSNVLSKNSANPFLEGNNLTEQAQYYYSLPDDQKEDALRKAVEYLKGENINDAMFFIEYLYSPDASKTWWANLGSIADIALSVPTGILGVIGGSALRARRVSRANRAIADEGLADIWSYSEHITRATDGARRAPVSQVLENAGDIPSASRMLAVGEIERLAKETAAVGSFEDLRGAAPLIFNPWGTVRQSNELSAEAMNRIVSGLMFDTEALLKAGITDANAVYRLERGSPAMQRAIDETVDALGKRYTFLGDASLGIKPANAAESPYQRIFDAKLTQQFEDYQNLMSRHTFLRRELQGIAESEEVTRPITSGVRQSAFDNMVVEMNLMEAQIATYQNLAQGRKLTIPQSRKFRDAIERREILEAQINQARMVGIMKKEDEALFDALQAAGGRVQKIASEIEGLTNNIISFPRAQVELFEEAIRNPDRTLRISLPHQVKTDPLSNTDHVVVQVGTLRAELFTSKEAAENQAKNIYGLTDYRVKRQGDGYCIELQKAVDETLPSVRDALVFDTTHQTPVGYFAALTKGFSPKSARYLFPEHIAQDRQLATLGSSALGRIRTLIDNKTIGALRKEEEKRFQQFADSQRRYSDPKSGTVGKFSTDQMDFEIAWKDMHGKFPNERETTAYWAYIRDYNMDLVMRNFRAVKEKMRLGAEMFDVPIGGIKSKPYIEGKVINRLPARAEEYDHVGALVLDGSLETIPTSHRNLKFLTPQREQKLLDEGYKIIQLAPYAQKNLRNAEHLKDVLPDRDISYLFVKNYEASPLDWMQIPKKPGGHISHVYNYYVRVPEVRQLRADKSVYYKDNNLFGFMDEKSAKQFTDAFNTARDMLIKHRSGLHPVTQLDIESYLARNLPAEWDFKTFSNLFDKSKGGILNIETPAKWTRRDLSTYDSGLVNEYPGLIKAADNPHNLYNDSLSLKYALERGETLETVARAGSMENPLYRIEKAPLMDLRETINRAGANLMRGRYMDDLKIKSTEHYIEEFGHLMQATKEEIRANPFQHLLDPVWKAGANPSEIAAAKNFRRATMELLGIQTDYAKATGYIKERLANDVAHNIFGDKAFKFTEPWLLHRLSPVDRMKSLIFYEKMGLWNPLQLFRQAHTVTHTAAVAGLGPTSRGYAAGMYAQALGFSEDVAMRGYIASQWRKFVSEPVKEFVTEPVGKALTKMTWKDEHFLEAYDGLKRSGFMNVSRETSDIGNVMDAGVSMGSLGRAADKSLIGFKRGEQIGRRTGYFTAYDEWRSANPAAIFDAVAQRSVLNRADILTVNMTQASNAAWQKGALAVPTQFAPFQIRLWEQMVNGTFGGKGVLTSAEKARVFLYNSAWYGVPTGIGITMLGVPVKEVAQTKYLTDDHLREYLSKYGMDPRDNDIAYTAWNGIGGLLSKYIAGNNPSAYAETFGPGSLTFTRDFIKGDKLFYEVMLGVSFNAAKELMISTDPFIRASLGTLGYGGGYELTGDDWKTLASNVSSLNHAMKVIVAMNTGEYISKNQIPVDKLNKWETYIFALTGQTPQRIQDLQRITQNNKDVKKVKDYFEKEYADNIGKAYRAFAKDDPELGATYFRRAYLDTIAGGFRDDEKVVLARRTMPRYETQFNAIMDRYSKQSPEKLKYYTRLFNDLKRN